MASGLLISALMLLARHGIEAARIPRDSPVTDLIPSAQLDNSGPLVVSPILNGGRDFRLLNLSTPVLGQTDVSYWTTSNGLAIINGDEAVGPVSQLVANNNLTQRSRDDSLVPRGFYFATKHPNGIIKFKYDTQATSDKVGSIVDSAIQAWRTAVPYLSFQQERHSETDINGIFTIRSVDCDGCHSSVGYHPDEPSYINLQQSSSACGGYCGVAETVHELGHAIGLRHEQQRPDRDEHLTYHCENVDPACTNMPAGKTCCNSGDPDVPAGCCDKIGNFNIISDTADAKGDYGPPYDFSSIMQYNRWAFSRQVGVPGFETLVESSAEAAAGHVAPPSNPGAISAGDARKLCEVYSDLCKASNPNACTEILGCPRFSFPGTFLSCMRPKFGCRLVFSPTGQPRLDCTPRFVSDPACLKDRARCRNAGCPS